MVYRRKRAVAAEVLREFRDGVITNVEFEARWPTNKGDRVFWAIFDQVWFFYDDIATHRLTGKHELRPEDRELFDRCILFLESDLEYDWPSAKFGDGRFLFAGPASSLRSWLGVGKLFGITILLSVLIGIVSRWYPPAGFLVPVLLLVWIVYGLGRLVYGMISLIRRRFFKPRTKVLPELKVNLKLKFQAGKEYWPFHSRPGSSESFVEESS
jgi:hypothetical protein